MNLRNLLLVAMPSVVYILHAGLYWGWLIDDAGISIAYAQNLVAGHGLVAQPGVPPVEGFSNPLWTLLLALLIGTGTFSTYWTTKVLNCYLAAITFAAMLSFCRTTIPDRNRAEVVFLCASVLTALCPPFVIWTSSGLENGLLAALVLVLLTTCAAWSIRRTSRLAFIAGFLAGLIALTRPDGIVYAASFPFAVLLHTGSREAFKPIGTFFVALLLTLAPYQVFRMAYFGDVVPNTFHAKHGVDLFGPFLSPTAGLFAGLAAFLFWKRAHNLLVLCAFTAMALYVYLALPPDWMPLYRFATALFPIGALFAMHLLSSAADAIRIPRVSHLIVFAAAASAILLAPSQAISAQRFAQSPTTPLAQITRDVALAFNRYQKAIGVQGATLLSPDIGGALMHSDLRIVDMAGLCDRKIAHLLNHDRQGLRDYLLTDVRPTFVHVHTVWNYISGLPMDRRFLSDYVRITETDWVRRDAIAHLGDPQAMLALLKDSRVVSNR